MSCPHWGGAQTEVSTPKPPKLPLDPQVPVVRPPGPALQAPPLTPAPPTPSQGLSACQQIRAALYLECSAKFRENVEDVFREAAKVALSALKKAQRQKQRRPCVLL